MFKNKTIVRYFPKDNNFNEHYVIYTVWRDDTEHSLHICDTPEDVEKWLDILGCYRPNVEYCY